MPGIQDPKAELCEKLSEMVDGCQDFVCEKAHACAEFVDLLEAPQKKLPPLAAHAGWQGLVAKSRLSGGDGDLPEAWVGILQEVPVDSIEEACAFAENNGQLKAVSAIAKELGDEALAKRAMSLVIEY